jgi:hypothetical protein
MATNQGPGLVNRFRPTALSFNSYGWKGSPLYNRADVPSQWVEGVGSADRTVIEQQLAYEWLNSSEAGGPGTIWINPPFLSGAAGRLMPGMVTSDGTPARILRGFIRRSEGEVGDMASMSRLYFMYNPETITRDYVSYLDQGALDPFNTVYQSGNLVAPPSIMDFTFSLFFDRQEEAVIATNPGVLVDYQYFDLVVRNVVPATDPNVATNSSLPDNGVMMVNPRDITVVFSPQLTVQGRPSNAKVSFTRFTHRMTPTRMQIDLTMRVTYFGPLKDMTPYVRDEATVQATIPWAMTVDNTFAITNDDIVAYKIEFEEYLKGLGQSTGEPGSSDGTDGPLSDEDAEARNKAFGSAEINSMAVDFGIRMSNEDNTQYNSKEGRTNISATDWISTDCSGYVYSSFHFLNSRYSASLQWNTSFPNTAFIWERFIRGGQSATPGQLIWDLTGEKDLTKVMRKIDENAKHLQKGDLLIRYKYGEGTYTVPGFKYSGNNHIAFFVAFDKGRIKIAHAGGKDNVGEDSMANDHLYTYNAAFRPLPAGSTSVSTPTPVQGPS